MKTPVYNTQGLFTYQLCMYESAELAGERDTPRAVVYTTLHFLHPREADSFFLSTDSEKSTKELEKAPTFRAQLRYTSGPAPF